MIHETVRPMTDGQRGDIIGTMVSGGFPKDLTHDEAQRIIGKKSEVNRAIQRALAELAGFFTIPLVVRPPLEVDKRKVRRWQTPWKLLKDEDGIFGDCPVKPTQLLADKEEVSLRTVAERVRKKNVTLLGQRYAETLLKCQRRIPLDFLGCHLIFAGTLWETDQKILMVPVLCGPGRWTLEFVRYDKICRGSWDLFVCLRDDSLLAAEEAVHAKAATS